MKKEGECYYVLLDLYGPETTYQPLFEVLNPLRAQQLEHGFPIWCSSVIVIRMSCIALNLSLPCQVGECMSQRSDTVSS